jgi:hypothetical protein
MAVVFLERSLGIFILTGIAVLGICCRLVVNRRCRKLIRQSEDLNTTKDKQLKRWKTQFEELSEIGNGITSPAGYLEKCFRRCRALGFPLRLWRHLAGAATVLSILGGLGLAAASYLLNLDYRIIVMNGSAGIVLGGAGILFQILLDNRGKEAMALEALVESFEKQLLPRIERNRHFRRGSLTPKPVQPPVTLGPEEEKVLEDIFREYLT